MTMLWTPTPLPLNAGPPFTYSDVSISEVSQTEAFVTGIDLRDRAGCIVCGRQTSLVHCYIVPKDDKRRWEFLRTKGLIPLLSKSVRHEARNGVVMCMNHHYEFESHYFYIRWEVTSRCFVLINHSRQSDLEPFHGRAVRLIPGDARTPFYGAFIDQEMRVRGRYPYESGFADRPMMLPIPWQSWITDPPSRDGGDIEGEVDDRGEEREDQERDEGEQIRDIKVENLSPTVLPTRSGKRDGDTTRTLHKKKKRTMITFRDPIANPSELEAIMRFACQQPSWKAAVIEGESWEGTAEENTAKYLRLLPPADGS